jgi:hypothetical protein
MKTSYSRSGSSHLGERGSKAKKKEALQKDLLISYLLTRSKEQLISALLETMTKADKKQLITEIIQRRNGGLVL